MHFRQHFVGRAEEYLYLYAVNNNDTKNRRQLKDYIQIGIEKCVRETAMLYFGGSAGQQRVPASYLVNFDLPLPPKEKQMEIARHVYELHQRAKTLQEEGKSVLDKAKQEVERMVLKGDSQ